MATKVEIRGTVLLPIGRTIQSIEWVEYDARAWLAPLWIVSPDGKAQRPLRIVAPRFAPGYDPLPGHEVLEIFREVRLPGSLLEQGHVPPELAPLVEVRENPDIWADVPAELG